ncbi:MAG TPA: DUF2231 domain-containing protein [Chitinophagaceae bacterium]|nr:DUF2231 domain-containing protein [Chitinophagaceae bacterium]
MFSNFPPLHSAIIHFPIALLLLAGVFGAISLFAKREFWKDLAFKSLLVGVIFTPFAVITGLIDEQKMGHDSVDPMLSFHKYNGLALMFFYQILAIWFWLRKKLPGNREYLAWVICLFLGSGMVMLQGYLGGEMVFTKGMSVKPVEESGMGHHGGKMEIKDSSKTGHGHDGEDKHDEGSMKDMKGMDNKDMKGMDNMKNMKGMDKKDMKGMDNMKDMKGMDKKDMKGMDDKDMKGMGNMKNMPGMDKKDMKGMEGMDNMKGMKGMENMKGMKGMKLIDNTKPYDNNPATEKPVKKN